MRRAGATLALALALGALGACSPGAPKGVSKDALDTAINAAIGDPNSCVLIGKAGSGATVYQFGSHVTCGKAWPSCDGAALRTTADLLKATARDGAPVKASCRSNEDGSRGVGWAAGPVVGRPDLAYAAVMEGKSTPPGLIMADKLDAAFKAAGL
jgi:hypothetical protein